MKTKIKVALSSIYTIIILAFAAGMVVAGLTSLTSTLNWNWSTTQSFQVFEDAEHTIQLGSSFDLGDFDPLALAGNETFYLYNDGNIPVTVYPHITLAVNFTVNQWLPSSVTLTPLQSAAMIMVFTVSGPGSARITFDTTPT